MLEMLMHVNGVIIGILGVIYIVDIVKQGIEFLLDKRDYLE
jgi:hypothetical protein